MTSEAHTIPDEIMKLARDIAASRYVGSQWSHMREYFADGLYDNDPVVVSAAKAIHDAVMAERERWSPASIYFERYCQDEADSAENCITEQQHTDAKAFAAAVRGEG